jgi:hypothetical protein
LVVDRRRQSSAFHVNLLKSGLANTVSHFLQS